MFPRDCVVSADYIFVLPNIVGFVKRFATSFAEQFEIPVLSGARFILAIESIFGKRLFRYNGKSFTCNMYNMTCFHL